MSFSDKGISKSNSKAKFYLENAEADSDSHSINSFSEHHLTEKMKAQSSSMSESGDLSDQLNTVDDLSSIK